ncbi:MAG: very short patch repair endonuclease [Oceanicaulis sp.]|uniref:very short patch repair endonuclease n=1 Tax=uncultured Oceanicaulis sp. TaxID=259940 RepID=UPI000C3A8467|nr:very short patch repair endonuclease [Oceanicaulis sp.]
MPDVVNPATRSWMMSQIRGSDTRPEMLIRSGLHRLGFRFRLHDRRLPGKPDLVLRRYRAAIFVNGCFWHGHNCHLFRLPSTRREFWEQKIARNRERDVEVRSALLDQTWRYLDIWECALKGRKRLALSEVLELAASWLESNTDRAEIRG